MLPSDAPFLETALALSALPFRPVTAGVLLLPAVARSAANAPCQAHVKQKQDQMTLPKVLHSKLNLITYLFWQFKRSFYIFAVLVSTRHHRFNRCHSLGFIAARNAFVFTCALQKFRFIPRACVNASHDYDVTIRVHDFTKGVPCSIFTDAPVDPLLVDRGVIQELVLTFAHHDAALLISHKRHQLFAPVKCAISSGNTHNTFKFFRCVGRRNKNHQAENGRSD